MIDELYDLLKGLIAARYSSEKLARLEGINTRLDLLRYQTRMLKDFSLIDGRRYGFVSAMINEIGKNLGLWINQQRSKAQ
jgi:hypothetical protein